LVGNIDALPFGKGCPFRDIYNSNHPSIQKLSWRNRNEKFPWDRIAGYAENLELATAKLPEDKRRDAVLIFSKRGLYEESPTVIHIDSILQHNYFQSVVIDLRNMDIHILSMIAQATVTSTKPNIAILGTETKLSKAIAKRRSRVTGLRKALSFTPAEESESD